MKIFYYLLANSIIATVTNMTVWFALVFFTYLETRSVFAVSIISGLYLVAVTLSGFWFGSIVDHNKKKSAMLISSIFTTVIFALCFVVYVIAPDNEFKNPASVYLWILAPLILLGVIAGNIRGIAMPTLVTLLIPEENRDKANGLNGTASGISFLITSVISGLLVGFAGMFWVLVIGVVLNLIAIIHLWFIDVPEKEIVHLSEEGDGKSKLDIKGTIAIISSIPGLFALIFFTTFNNFLGGVFMSLMDAYGLSLVSVQVWGILWGAISTGFIVGGLFIAKYGLGKNPLSRLFMANIIIWIVSSVFTVYPSIIILVIGMFIYITVMPFIEACEHTIIQKVVPPERQGRVFGFAQSVEIAASPITAFLIGPIAQFIFIPFMTTGAGVDLIGSWFGTGEARGIALLFTITGIIGLIVTLSAMQTRPYRLLSERYRE